MSRPRLRLQSLEQDPRWSELQESGVLTPDFVRSVAEALQDQFSNPELTSFVQRLLQSYLHAQGRHVDEMNVQMVQLTEFMNSELSKERELREKAVNTATAAAAAAASTTTNPLPVSPAAAVVAAPPARPRQMTQRFLPVIQVSHSPPSAVVAAHVVPPPPPPPPPSSSESSALLQEFQQREALLRERLAAMSLRNDKLVQELSQRSLEKASVEQMMQEVSSQLADLQGNYEINKSEMSRLRQELEDREATLSLTQKSLESLESRFAELESSSTNRIADLQASFTLSESKAQRLSNDLEQINTHILDVDSYNTHMTTELAAMKLEFYDQKNALHVRDKEIESLKQELHACQKLLAQKQPVEVVEEEIIPQETLEEEEIPEVSLDVDSESIALSAFAPLPDPTPAFIPTFAPAPAFIPTPTPTHIPTSVPMKAPPRSSERPPSDVVPSRNPLESIPVTKRRNPSPMETGNPFQIPPEKDEGNPFGNPQVEEDDGNLLGGAAEDGGNPFGDDAEDGGNPFGDDAEEDEGNPFAS